MLQTELYFHNKESFQAFVKKQVRTSFYLPVSQSYTTIHNDRHSLIKVNKTQISNWAGSSWLTSDRMKVTLEPSSYCGGRTFAFCYVTTKEMFDKAGITPDMTRNDSSE
jgi:hypothetical protein